MQYQEINIRKSGINNLQLNGISATFFLVQFHIFN